MKIARRYFFSKKKKQFINIISIISMIVVAVGSMALLIALSVFNGLEDVVRGLHDTFNPDLQIAPRNGKSFEVNDILLKKIQSVSGVDLFTEIIEDNALLKYREAQVVATVKGVGDNFTKQSKMELATIYGKFKLKENNRNYAVLGRNVQYLLSISLRNDIEPIQVWYPKKNKKINLSSMNPEKSFNRKNIFPAGVFSIEKNYDEKYVFVPLEFMQELLDYGNKRTSIEIKIKKLAHITTVQKELQKVLGKEFIIKTSEQQQASLLRAIQIEKLFVYLTLSFILAIASFNIFFALMMLVIDKKKDIAILQAMGANSRTIRRIFISEGAIIALSGAFLGLFLGGLICWLQQQYGFVTMGTSTTVVSAYPVRLELFDFIYIGFTIILITLLSSYIPAINATKINLRENLV